jgi:hypothetical protein
MQVTLLATPCARQFCAQSQLDLCREKLRITAITQPYVMCRAPPSLLIVDANSMLKYPYLRMAYLRISSYLVFTITLDTPISQPGVTRWPAPQLLNARRIGAFFAVMQPDAVLGSFWSFLQPSPWQHGAPGAQ